ncbi:MULTISPECIES: hypothetical protein [Haloferacaceae]|uniref:hypothetical protein n=1 Tax=Haloferacaceae TaxID=1644056 RepID=UPI000B176AD1|nr:MULTISPECIES: hypothetical protein [Halorubraceae]MCG1008182.1 hypothetical protein [Halorubrum lacusprofundi]
MKRRTLVGLTVGVSTGFSGCLSQVLGGCPGVGEIEVFVAGDVPKGVDVLDGASEQFVDSKYLSQALSEAEENYEPEMAGVSTSINTSNETNHSEVDDGLDDQSFRDPDARVARVSSQEMYSDGTVEGVIGFREETYVRYNNRTYIMTYGEIVC